MRELHDLNAAGFVVVNRHGNGKLHLLRCSAFAVHATAVVRAHFCLDVVGAWVFGKAEGLDAAFSGLAPALKELEGLIFEESEADAAAALNLGGVEVTAAAAA